VRYQSKKQWIIKHVKDKKVLDLGCVAHSLARTEEQGWLHGVIREHARSVVGVDCLQDEVRTLKEQGHDVVCANVEAMELGEKFEVIVAADIVEHLSNCGKFMERAREHLAPGGLLLLTTPNPVHLLRFVQLLFLRRVIANPEHTCWFTQEVLSHLAGRYGLEIVDVAYIDLSYQIFGFKWLPFLLLNSMLRWIQPKFCETMAFTLKTKTTDKVQ
jgi:2-polyprenyl-3-methyl-5-hydroxy-6-metoxy-1,4-benzoquinol methylase